jgi:uncharacterized protein YggE
MNPVRIAAVAVLVLAAAALAGVGLPEEARSDQGTPLRGITVNASAEIEAAPDRAALQVGVDTQASNAKQALAQNAERVRAVIEALRKAGVGKDDLQTSQVSLWPETGPDGTGVTGYRAQNSVAVELDVAKAGEAVDAAVAAGANTVSGPTLSVEEREHHYRKALAEAVDAARAKADAIAGAAGVNVGRVTAVVESAGYEEPQPYFTSAARDTMESSTPIEPGKQQIQATVTVTFAVA